MLVLKSFDMISNAWVVGGCRLHFDVISKVSVVGGCPLLAQSN
jgi:hypothetical protein